MLQLQEAIKKIIEKFIVNITAFGSDTLSGTTTIPVDSARRYQIGDGIAVYNTDILNKTGEGEIRTIKSIPDCNTIVVCDALVDNYPQETSFVQKMVGDRFLEAIHIGNPGKYTHFPAISIDAKDKKNEWITLESTGETFNVDITVYVESADYEKSYRLMQIYIKRIENALFRSLYPLVEPFDCATLSADVVATDNVIQISDPNDLVKGQLGWIFLESSDFLKSNSVETILDAGVFQLRKPVGRPFFIGDKVIRPRRHFYDAFPRGIQYGTINQESGVFKAAVLNFMAKEEIRRGVPYQDPLDF